MRRQGLEPRTDALREPDGRSLDLLGSVDTCPDLGIGYRCCPLMTPVADRSRPQRSPREAREGHGRRGRTWRRRGGDGQRLGRWVRPVLGDHEPRWQAPGERAAADETCRRSGRLLEDEREHRGRLTPNLDVAEPEQVSLEESMHAVEDHPPTAPQQQVKGTVEIGCHRPLIVLLVAGGIGFDLGGCDLVGPAVVAPVGQGKMPSEVVDRGVSTGSGSR